MHIYSQPVYINIPKGCRFRAILTNAKGEDFVIMDVKTPEFNLNDDGTESDEPRLREHLVSMFPMGLGLDQVVERVRRVEPSKTNTFVCDLCGHQYAQGCVVSTMNVETGKLSFGCGNCAQRLHAAWREKVEGAANENPE